LNPIKELYEDIVWRYRMWQESQFDSKRAIDTRYEKKDFFRTVVSDNKDFAVAYEPVHQYVMTQILDDLPADIKNRVFIDLGSGKGRAVFMAADRQFKKLIGVEFSSELHQAAMNNLSAYKRKTNSTAEIEFICSDAVDYELPESDLVIFMYNPFHGKVMQHLIEKLDKFIEEKKYEITVYYRNPQCASMFEQSRQLELVADKDSYNIYASKRLRSSKWQLN
jgi:SAM-dependent methyltransferase